MSDEYQFQTSIKHGKNGSIMTNVRGVDADQFGLNLTVTQQDFAPLIEDLAATLQATDTLGESFPSTAPVQEQPQSRYGSGGRPSYGGGGGQQPAGGGQADGQRCDHNVPRKFVSATSKRTGKPFQMWACTVEQDPNRPQCPPIFV